MTKAKDAELLAATDDEVRSRAARQLSRWVARGEQRECWQWTGVAVCHHGYGRINFSGVSVRAHRLAWIIANSRAVPDGQLVCHSCDNPKCCNPSHLFIGSHKDNTGDMLSKGRGSRPPRMVGEAHPHVKFSASAAKAIAESKATAKVLAAQYGVCEKTIYRIKQGRSWRQSTHETV